MQFINATHADGVGQKMNLTTIRPKLVADQTILKFALSAAAWMWFC